MVKKRVKKNVTDKVTKWEQALTDAEIGLSNAQKDVMQWKGTISVIRNKIKTGVPWPGEAPDATQSPSA